MYKNIGQAIKNQSTESLKNTREISDEKFVYTDSPEAVSGGVL